MTKSTTRLSGPVVQHDDFPRETSLAFLVRDAGRVVARAFAVHIEPLGVNVSTWFMLRLLSENPGLTQREISKHLGILEPSALETLVSMEQRGLITRDRSTEDRRKRIVSLTAEGRRVLDQIKPIAKS